MAADAGVEVEEELPLKVETSRGSMVGVRVRGSRLDLRRGREGEKDEAEEEDLARGCPRLATPPRGVL